jgi:hypothetical protein
VIEERKQAHNIPVKVPEAVEKGAFTTEAGGGIWRWAKD